MNDLKDSVVIVTGASRGIGKAIAQLFASEGARVVCAARTMKQEEHFLDGSMAATVEEIKTAGGQAIAVQTDVSDEKSCTKLVETARAQFGPIDVLVNDAVLSYFLPVKDFPVKRWVRAFAVNVHGPFMLSQKVIPDMIEKGRGAIVNISSGAAIGPGRGPYTELFPGAGGGTMYGATKAAIERFTQGLAQEIYPYGISVTCLSPSMVVPTPGTIYHDLVTGPDDPRGEPPEMMAKAVLLLATETVEKISGRVTYSQAILKEFGLIKEGKGIGIEADGSGFSKQ